MTDTQTAIPEGLAAIQALIQQGNITEALSALDRLDSSSGNP